MFKKISIIYNSKSFCKEIIYKIAYSKVINISKLFNKKFQTLISYLYIKTLYKTFYNNINLN